jgi:hypothetical protein
MVVRVQLTRLLFLARWILIFSLRGCSWAHDVPRFVVMVWSPWHAGRNRCGWRGPPGSFRLTGNQDGRAPASVKPATLRLQPWQSFAQDVWVVLLTNFTAPVRIGRSRRIPPRAHLPESPLIK